MGKLAEMVQSAPDTFVDEVDNIPTSTTFDGIDIAAELDGAYKAKENHAPFYSSENVNGILYAYAIGAGIVPESGKGRGWKTSALNHIVAHYLCTGEGKDIAAKGAELARAAIERAHAERLADENFLRTNGKAVTPENLRKVRALRERLAAL